MSARVNMPAAPATSMVLENLGWKCSREGPMRKGTLPTMRGAERRSNTCRPGWPSMGEQQRPDLQQVQAMVRSSRRHKGQGVINELLEVGVLRSKRERQENARSYYIGATAGLW